MKIAFCFATLLVIAGCATRPSPPPEPIIKIVEMPIEVPVPCKPKLTPQPIFPDTDTALKAAGTIHERVKLLVVGRLMRAAREIELLAAVKSCE